MSAKRAEPQGQGSAQNEQETEDQGEPTDALSALANIGNILTKGFKTMDQRLTMMNIDQKQPETTIPGSFLPSGA